MGENLYEETLDGAAIIDHEIFSSWVRAGFTREEALQLLLQQKVFAQNMNFHDSHCDIHREGE
jgi:hypothetical protein